MNNTIHSEDFSKGLRHRIIVLVFMSTLVVALTFGLSFYFALISNETAVAGQVPELEGVVSTLKRILVVNTLAFAAVIIASLYILSALVTRRMFRPLESIMKDLSTIGRGTLPSHREPLSEEPFAGFDEMFGTVLSVLQQREEREIEEIRQCLSTLSDMGVDREIRSKLAKILEDKNTFIGNKSDRIAAKGAKGEKDQLFMQPI